MKERTLLSGKLP